VVRDGPSRNERSCGTSCSGPLSREESRDLSKAEQVIEILEARVRRGKYLLREFPPERDLAEEMGVARMTARKAILALVDMGVLAKLPNGRIQPNRVDAAGRAQKHVALLLPAGVSADHQLWQQAVHDAAEAADITVHPHVFRHPDSMFLQEALEAFDGVFLLCESVPSDVTLLTAASKPVFALGTDLSGVGIPSVRLFPPGCGRLVLDHLYDLGHRRIGLLSTGEETDRVLSQRVCDWEEWMRGHPDCDGQRILRDAPWHADRAEQSLEAMDQLLSEGAWEDTALLCTTVWMALGAMKALREHGVVIGSDVSVCTFNGENIARWTNPSITSLEMPDPAALLKRCMDVVPAGERSAWRGSLLLAGQPALFTGQSSGAVRDA